MNTDASAKVILKLETQISNIDKIVQRLCGVNLPVVLGCH